MHKFVQKLIRANPSKVFLRTLCDFFRLFSLFLTIFDFEAILSLKSLTMAENGPIMIKLNGVHPDHKMNISWNFYLNPTYKSYCPIKIWWRTNRQTDSYNSNISFDKKVGTTDTTLRVFLFKKLFKLLSLHQTLFTI